MLLCKWSEESKGGASFSVDERIRNTAAAVWPRLANPRIGDEARRTPFDPRRKKQS